jgi:hypothetical protein
VEAFGEDMIDLIGRKAAQVVQESLTSMMQRLATLEQAMKGVDATVTRTASDVFEENLSRVVPDWRTLNTDPAFLAWLDEAEEFSGATKLSLLQSAYSQLDVARVARFFNMFTGSKSQPTAEPTPTPKPRGLDALVAPGKSKTPSQAASQQTVKVWSLDDVTALYDDLRHKRITPEQFDAQELDMFKAQREGRFNG